MARDLEDRLDAALAAGDREDKARAIWESLTPAQRRTLLAMRDAGEPVYETRALRRRNDSLIDASLAVVVGLTPWRRIGLTNLGRAVAAAGQAGA